jgi:hypothetical protein
VLRNPCEVRIRGEQLELMSDAELSEDRIDRPDLHPSPASAVPDLRGLEVIAAIRRHEGQGSEARDDRLLRARSLKALEELLVDETGGDDEITAAKRSCERADFGLSGGGVAPKRQGPDARVDEQAQSRDRSRL